MEHKATACFYNIKHFHEKVEVYSCGVFKKDIDSETTFDGEHYDGKTNDEIEGEQLRNFELLSADQTNTFRHRFLSLQLHWISKKPYRNLP
jgi:hypothetical protein